MREGLLDTLGRQRAFEQSEIGGIVGPDIHIRCITFVAGARMRDIADEAAGVSSRGYHATNICKVGLTRSRAIKTDLVITQGTIDPRKPPPPAGPQHSSDSTSHRS